MRDDRRQAVGEPARRGCAPDVDEHVQEPRRALARAAAEQRRSPVRAHRRHRLPGMTANFDAGAVAALGVTLADWIACGEDYAAQMRACASRLAGELSDRGVEPFACEAGFTDSHQFALLAGPFGGGSAGARILEAAGFLTSGI